MLNLSPQALRVAVVQAVMSDPKFRDELAKTGLPAIEARFGKHPYAVEVFFEGEGELSLLIPEKTDQVARTVERAVKDVGDRTPTRGQLDALLVDRSWNDPAFLATFTQDPHGTLDAELKKYGSSVPAGKTVRLYREQPGQCVIVIPRPGISGEDEFSDAELEAIAGGEWLIIAGAVATSITTVIVCEWVCSAKVAEKIIEP